ncbi:MAG: Mur ligase family protein [Bacteroidota bacterium]
MKLQEIHSVYCIGIGGIGMSAIARWFQQRGAVVAGYDRVASPLTRALQDEGIAIHYEDSLALVGEAFKQQASTLVMYTPAVPQAHGELRYFWENGFQVKKRSEVLGLISEGHYTVAVGGTHGKTTTSSMIAHLLHGSAEGCSAFVGGIMTNYDSNLIVGGEQAPVVAEADEFDRSFLRLKPNYSILTSLDPDHLDIYGTEEAMRDGYLEFLSLNERKADLLLHHDTVEQLDHRLDTFRYRSFGLQHGDIVAENIRVDDGYNVFDYVGEQRLPDLKMQLPGNHNISNALAAITVALDRGMSADLIIHLMEDYKGVKRRFEYQYRDDRVVYIDDYAHHPSEIEALISSVRSLYPDKRVTAIFQPHLFTRTRDSKLEKNRADSL